MNTDFIILSEDYFFGVVDYTAIEKHLNEAKVESRSCDVARKAGWFTRKMSTPANRGIMDRVFIKDGRTVWIEYKKVGHVPTGLQRDTATQMKKVGAEVWWTDTVRGTKLILGIDR